MLRGPQMSSWDGPWAKASAFSDLVRWGDSDPPRLTPQGVMGHQKEATSCVTDLNCSQFSGGRKSLFFRKSDLTLPFQNTSKVCSCQGWKTWAQECDGGGFSGVKAGP